jgi:hypothetical protein
VLPINPGRAGMMMHDYKRHDTTTHAALSIPDGSRRPATYHQPFHRRNQ